MTVDYLLFAVICVFTGTSFPYDVGLHGLNSDCICSRSLLIILTELYIRPNVLFPDPPQAVYSPIFACLKSQKIIVLKHF